MERWRWLLGIAIFFASIFGLFKLLEIYLTPLSDFNQRKELIKLLVQIIRWSTFPHRPVPYVATYYGYRKERRACAGRSDHRTFYSSD